MKNTNFTETLNQLSDQDLDILIKTACLEQRERRKKEISVLIADFKKAWNALADHDVEIYWMDSDCMTLDDISFSY